MTDNLPETFLNAIRPNKEEKNMIKIGLCGSSGAGKGHVSSIFRKHGVEYIDTDGTYTKIAVPHSACLNEICTFFGDEILNPDGTLNKTNLAKRVFEGENSAQRLKLLNRITHKYIRDDVERTIAALEKRGCVAVIIDAPVLFESGFNELCDVTVCVTAPMELKIQRIMKRDKISKKKAIVRIESQLPDERLCELCDYEIKNDGRSDLKEQVNEVLRGIGIEK